VSVEWEVMGRAAGDSFGYCEILLKTFRAFFPPVPKDVVNSLTLGAK